jgi:hypothetical protein
MRVFLQNRRTNELRSAKVQVHRATSGYPVFFLAVFIFFSLSYPLKAERLRISPDDLRLRVAVSEELPASVRREIVDLAKSTPLPVTDGLLQTEQLFLREFSDRGWSDKRETLVRYYFFISRMDQSHSFSDEFLRRQTLIRNGIELMNAYIQELNPLIAQAPYTHDASIDIPTIQQFPLARAERTAEGRVEVLSSFPPPTMKLGRRNLRLLRAQAAKDKALLEERLNMLRRAEKSFLQEVSLVGRELIKMRPYVRQWVKIPGEGLPFSR